MADKTFRPPYYHSKNDSDSYTYMYPPHGGTGISQERGQRERNTSNALIGGLFRKLDANASSFSFRDIHVEKTRGTLYALATNDHRLCLLGLSLRCETCVHVYAIYVTFKNDVLQYLHRELYE